MTEEDQSFSHVPGDYNFHDELKIRKVLEANSDYKFEFTKNPDKKDTDIKFYKWEFDGVDWIKQHYGYIELERADSWVVDNSLNTQPGQSIEFTALFPDDWVWSGGEVPNCTFLKRKIYEFDWERGRFTDTPKPNYQRTVYIKFDNSIQECFAAPIIGLLNHATTTPRSDDTQYNGSQVVLPADHSEVYVGLDNVMVFLDEFMNHQSSSQGRFDLDDWK